MSEWVDWHGGACPVDYTVRVDIEFRDRCVCENEQACNYRWSHIESISDIVKYRIRSDENAESSAGTKHDQGKPRLDLLLTGFPRALESLGQVLAFGAEKYAPNNWKLVDQLDSRYQAAQMRHELSHCKGELLDEESGLPHLTHEAFCILARLEHLLETQQKDD